MRDNQGEKFIDVDASRWSVRSDVYDAILFQLGAPEWHGANMNALIESIIQGEINAVDPPYTLRIRGTANLPAGVTEELSWLKEGIEEGREEFEVRNGYKIDVDVELLP